MSHSVWDFEAHSAAAYEIEPAKKLIVALEAHEDESKSAKLICVHM